MRKGMPHSPLYSSNTGSVAQKITGNFSSLAEQRNKLDRENMYEQNKKFRTISLSCTFFLFIIGLAYFRPEIHYKSFYDGVYEIPTTPQNKFVNTPNGTVLLPEQHVTFKDLPDGVKARDVIEFTKDGHSVIVENSEVTNQGPDVVWKENGRWYGKLRDFNFDRKDLIMIADTPTDCGCPVITLVNVK